MFQSCTVYPFLGFSFYSFSFYLLIFVPTKLNNFTRFVIHGHNLTSAITQLYLTLGTIMTNLFPCKSAYVSGFLSDFGIEPLDQMNIQITLMTISKSFTLLLTINRTFAINAWMKKHKNPILIIFFAQLIGQVVVSFVNGLNTKDGGEETRQACLAIITYEYPSVMYTSRGFDMSLQDESGQFAALIMSLTTALYMIIAIVCVIILIRSIREQAKSSQFLANQRRITSGILCFLVIEIVGLGIPFIVTSACFILRMGNSVVSQLAFISICVYPIFGPYYVLMSNTDYRNKVKGILKKGWFLKLTLLNTATGISCSVQLSISAPVTFIQIAEENPAISCRKDCYRPMEFQYCL